MSKRAFPYYSELEELELKRPAIQGRANPGREAADPRLFDGGRSLEVSTQLLSRCSRHFVSCETLL